MFLAIIRVSVRMIKGMVHGVLMEVNWLHIVLVIKSVIKHVMVLMFIVITLLMLIANLSIMMQL